MKTITFPLDDSLNFRTQIFSSEYVVVVALNKFIKNIFSNILLGLNPKKTLKISYTYVLNDFEIKYLSERNENELVDILCDCRYSIPLNFYIESVRARFLGVIDLSLKFINNDVFEKSYFEVDIELVSESDLEKIFQINDVLSFYNAFFEFQGLAWGRVFAFIKKREFLNKILIQDNSEYDFFAPISNNKNDAIFLENLSVNVSLPDTYHILNDLFVKFKEDKNYILISIDDILSHRGLKKNVNFKGYRSCYKEKQRMKVKEDMKLLSVFGAIYSIELSENLYCISLDLANVNLYCVPRKILEYSQKTELCEKFIGEFLYSINFYSKNACVKVNDLLRIVRQTVKSDRLSILRDRLEKALDRLQDDNVISSWIYKNINEAEIKHISGYEKLKIIFSL